MFNINLAYPERSRIKYKISNFPDGQQDIKLEGISVTRGGELSAAGLQLENTKIIIESRFNNFRDLELIICTVKALRLLKVKEIHLYIPYLLGARSDRQFVKGGTSYLRDVVAPIINAQNFESVTVLDAHSDVSEAVINNIIRVDNSKLFKYFQEQHQLMYPVRTIQDVHDKITLVSPDGGSLKKIYNIAEQFAIEDIIIASKHRDIKTGQISSTEVVVTQQQKLKNLIIVDDICDGGRTFIELAKALRKAGAEGNIILIITHGIFSKGFDEIKEHIDYIFTTNSVKDINDDFIHQLDVFI